jgi:hypothetical protein
LAGRERSTGALLPVVVPRAFGAGFGSGTFSANDGGVTSTVASAAADSLIAKREPSCRNLNPRIKQLSSCPKIIAIHSVVG